MTQRKHLDDFLRGRIIRRLECGRTQLEVSKEHGIAQSVISRLWQRFQDDGNVSRYYSTGQPQVTTLNEERYIWQLLPKETDRVQHQTCLVSSLQLPVHRSDTMMMSPHQASSPVVGTRARNFTSLNLLRIVWVDTYPPSLGGRLPASDVTYRGESVSDC
ncbi:uncharacterized protein TNCV_1911321 [Trichonephila clavipes]|nr:uncharacterized protein TNCV_1911321 [Trichonephila clavipes]